MRNSLLLFLLSICCLGLFGCPYESHVPISTPSIPVDSRYLGQWKSSDEVYNSYKVLKASETEYEIIQENISGVQRFKGHLSEVKNALFMNLYSDSTDIYYIYRVKMDPEAERLTLIPVSAHIREKFGSMEGFRTYLERNVNFQSLYNEREKADYVRLPNQSGSAALN